MRACRRGLDSNPKSEPLRILLLGLLLQAGRGGEAEGLLNGWTAEFLATDPQPKQDRPNSADTLMGSSS
jgi:hypothetical protein